MREDVHATCQLQCQWWSGKCHAKHAEKAASVHNTCLDKLSAIYKEYLTGTRPILEYCSPVWSPRFKDLINKIESVQKNVYGIVHIINVTKHYFSNRIVNVWNTAPSLLSFCHQSAKFDSSSFCLNFSFFLCILFCVITIVLTVLSMYFLRVSGLRVHLSIINKWTNEIYTTSV